jgi:hypothetical protein
MRILINTYHFDALKKLVLENANHDHITAAHCKGVAVAIEKRTKERVSETTVKRLFGFAESRSKPSAFTMDVLSKFCGYKHWEDYLENAYKFKESEPGNIRPVWDFRKQIHRITTNTLQHLQDRSGIPFRYTIPRRFLDDHLDYFARSYFNGTILFAPTGYGKTLALAHWVASFLNKSPDHHAEGDLVFFLSFNTLSNAYFSGRNVHEWLLYLLGYNRDDEFSRLMVDLKLKGQKLYLIIDGLDDTIIKGETFRLIISQITDLFSCYREYSSFKMILTMRTTTLIVHQDILKIGDQEWFMGFDSDNVNSNIPLLDMTELRKMAVRINPSTKHVFTHEEVKQLRYPIYLQYYYRSCRDNFSFSKIDETSIFEHVFKFVQTKVYQGNSSKKQVILNAICENIDYQQQTFYAVKDDVTEHIGQQKAGYHEMLASGYIIETKCWKKHEVKIGFSNEDFLSYAVASYLLGKTTNLVNKQLITSINGLMPTCVLRLKIIKWFIFYAIQTEQLISDDILNVELCQTERAEVIQFWETCLRNVARTKSNSSFLTLNTVSNQCTKGY